MNSPPNTTTHSDRLAAPAPIDDADDADAEDDTGADVESAQLHELFEAWARWVRTRRFYVKPSLPASLLGRLRTKGTGRPSNGGPNAVASAELMALHLAMLAQPSESLDRRVFELHYFWRVSNIKVAADSLGISRQHWYRLLKDFRLRVHAASREILEINLQAGADLPSLQEQADDHGAAK